MQAWGPSPRMLRDVADLDIFQLTALILGLPPKDRRSRDLVLEFATDDRRTMLVDIVDNNPELAGRLSRRILSVLEALQMEGLLVESPKTTRARRARAGGLSKAAREGALQAKRDKAIADFVAEDVKANGKRGHTARAGRRFGMTAQNISLRLEAYGRRVRDAEELAKDQVAAQRHWALIAEFRRKRKEA